MKYLTLMAGIMLAGTVTTAWAQSPAPEQASNSGQSIGQSANRIDAIIREVEASIDVASDAVARCNKTDFDREYSKISSLMNEYDRLTMEAGGFSSEYYWAQKTRSAQSDLSSRWARTCMLIADGPPPVAALPPEVQSSRHIDTPEEIRVELEGVIEACKNVSDPEDEQVLRDRYDAWFNKLRELRAVRDGLREKLDTDISDVERQDALNQIKRIDAANDGALSPTQLECPRKPGEPIKYFGAVTEEEIGFDPALSIFLGANFGLEGLGKAADSIGATAQGYGFQSTGPGTETFAGEAPNEWDTNGFELGLRHQLDSGPQLGFVVYFLEGDGRSTFDIPAGGAIDVGNVYGERSPSGSTGLNIGNRGISGSATSELETYGFKASASRTIVSGPDFTAEATLSAEVVVTERNTIGEIQAFVFGTPITQQREQSVSDSYYGLGADLRLEHQISPQISIFGQIGLGAFLLETEMDATEVNDCGLCPPADQNFTLNFKDSNSELALRGNAELGASFRLTDRLGFEFGGTASYIDTVGEIANPRSGDDVLAGNTTRLTTTDAHEIGAFARLRFYFQ